MEKNLPANAGDTKDAGSIPGREDPLEEEMATHSSILAWKSLWTEEPGRLQSLGLHTVRYGLKQLSTHTSTHYERKSDLGGFCI